MGKHNYFSLLKLALCFLCFASSWVVFGVTIDVPDNIDNESGKEFYVDHDKERNLWFCMELVTMNNRDWWYGRIAYERSILYKCCEREEEEVRARGLRLKLEGDMAVKTRIDELKRNLPAEKMNVKMAEILKNLELCFRSGNYSPASRELEQLRSTSQLDCPDGENFCELIALTSVLSDDLPWCFDKKYMLFIKSVMSRCKIVETYLKLKYPDTNIIKWLDTCNRGASTNFCWNQNQCMMGTYGQDYWNAKIAGDKFFMSLADYARSSPLCDDCIKYRGGYQDVFNGFVYNLEDYAKGGSGSTWVAYVSSRPVNGPLYLEGSFDSASSPDIKMAVTVKISDPFYSPLGIFRSLVSRAYDNKNGLADVKNLSMFLHSFIARTVGVIRPSVKYMVFRPRALMLDIIKKSGIKYTVSKDGETQNVALPYVGFSLSEYDDMMGYNILTALFLVDPRIDTKYNFDDRHWFRISPYLGKFAKQQLAKFPFIIIDLAELAEYPNREQAGHTTHSLVAIAHPTASSTTTTAAATSAQTLKQSSPATVVHQSPRGVTSISPATTAVAVTSNTLINVPEPQVLNGNKIYYSDYIPVIGKSFPFALSGDFQSQGNPGSKLYFSIDCHDKDQRSIRTHHFIHYTGTETVLVSPCTAKDKVIVVKDASKWKPDQNGCIAFNIDPSGTDIPNFDVSSGFGVESINKLEEGRWEITLTNVIGKGYLSGTKIREHKSAGGFIHCGASGVTVPNTWTKYNGVLTKEQLFPGTAFVRIVVWGNYGQTPSSTLQFKNIELRQAF